MSRRRTAAGKYRLRVVLHLMHRNSGTISEEYTYTSDAFCVVAAPPRKAAAARREEPPRRASVA